MEILNKDTHLELVETLTIHPDNPRIGNVEAVTDSIRENGWFGSLLVQLSSRTVLAGNHRLAAAIALGMKEVPVTWLDVDDDRARKILLSDNRTADVAGYDDAALAKLLQECEDGVDGLLGTGYDADYLDRLMADIEGGDQPIRNAAAMASKESVQRFHETELRQIMLLMNVDEYDVMLTEFGRIMQEQSLETNFAVVNFLLQSFLDNEVP